MQFVTDIVARTDGLPLFAEELTKALVETRRVEQVAQTADSPAALIPPTLYDSLMARLDRIPEVKELAQTAACIGRDFEFRTLAAIAGIKHEALLRALDRLVEAELLFRRGEPPDATYSFKHALVRDAAYESQLRSRRREVHEAIVRAMEKSSASTHPEMVAQHAVHAGQTHKAMTPVFGRPASMPWNASQTGKLCKTSRTPFACLRPFRRARTGTGRSLRCVWSWDCRLLRRADMPPRRSKPTTEARSSCHNVFLIAKPSSQARDRCGIASTTAPTWSGASISPIGLSSWPMQSASDEKRALAFRALGSTLMNRGEFAKADDAFDKCLSVAAHLPPATWIKVHGEVPPIVAQQYKGFICAVLDASTRRFDILSRPSKVPKGWDIPSRGRSRELFMPTCC